jgi:hypothetical protein
VSNLPLTAVQIAGDNSFSSTGGSGGIDPIQNPQSWDVIVLAGVTSPGIIAEMSGFDRVNGWQIKKGKGSDGGTLTYVQRPPAEGHIKFVLSTAADFQAWASFRPLFLYNPAKNAAASEQAVSIWHPALADLSISSVVTKKISPIRHMGKGKYEVTVDLIEFAPPPASNVVNTPTTTNDNSTILSSPTGTTLGQNTSASEPLGQGVGVAQIFAQGQAPVNNRSLGAASAPGGS